MKKGYEIMILPQLDDLFSNPKYFEFAVAVFYWLIPQVEKELSAILGDAHLEVIKMMGKGTYPILAIVHPNIDELIELESVVEETITRILRDVSVADLVQFISQSGIDWREETHKIMVYDPNS